MIASDSSCTSPLILDKAISEGLILHVQSGTKATVQVAGGNKLPGINYVCLLPLRKTDNECSYVETLATAVPTLIEDILIIECM